MAPAPIATYVFFDLGTTSLNASHNDITEIHMIAIKCDDLNIYFREEEKVIFAEPPPKKNLHCRLKGDVMFLIGEDGCQKCNLEDETVAFLEDLEKPLCLLAHNGNRFDFRLLGAKLGCVKGFSPKGIVCADTMAAFYDILEPDSLKTSDLERLKGSFPWPGDYYNDRLSYKLADVFERTCREEPNLEGAGNRNDAVVEISLNFGFTFMLWVEENNKPFPYFCRM